MTSVKETAIEYEERETRVVSDLELFDINMEVYTYEGETQEGKKFKYKYVEDKNGVRYRVPWSVITQIKDYLEEQPEQALFKVKKKGEGMNTRYTVIPSNK